MGFGNIFGKKSENADEHLKEISKIKQEIEKEDKIFEKELPSKYNLLQEFHVNDLKNLCIDVLGQEPPVEYYNDSIVGRRELVLLKEDYVHFIVDELGLSEIRNYALKKKILSSSATRHT